MRRLLIIAMALGLLVSLPLMAADPIGSFGGIIGGGNAGSGVIPLHGWATHDVGVSVVDVYVDGIIAGRASYGSLSPGVAVLYPTYPNAGFSRWGFRLDTTQYLNANHEVSILVTASTGETSWLATHTYEFLNATPNLVPFGEIEFPIEDTEFFGVCDPTDPNRRYSVINGYVVDAGLTPEDSGVKWVQLMINGSIVFDSQLDCNFIPSLGGMTNCYGLIHQNSEQWYPFLVDTPHAGFRFVIDVGELVALGYAQGHHVLTIRAGDLGSQQENIDNRRVSFFCDDLQNNEGAFGHIFRPAVGALYSDVVTFSGWALDWEGIFNLEIYVDGDNVGSTVVDQARPGVNAAHPGYPDSLAPGWSFTLDTTTLEDGPHSFWVEVVDLFSQRTTIGERTFHVYNP